jgi:nicotinamidase-related amidase
MNTTERKSLNSAPIRSPLLMSSTNTALVVIDVQERLVPLIGNHLRIIWNISRLIDCAELLQVRTLATEQYPKGLGHTTGALASRLTDIHEKRVFSCRECSHQFETLQTDGIDNLLLAGIESHVCVQQTALDMLSQGFNVFVAVDATGSRNKIDHENAIVRMQMSGVTTTTTESVMFEWCESSTHAQFKAVSKLVQQTFNE